MPVVDKRECAELNYGFDWGDPNDSWLEPGETIGVSTWIVSPVGLTILTSTVNGGTQTLVRLAGGVVGQTYAVDNHIVTTPTGDEDCRTLSVTVLA